jgi:hypothetical protein
MARGGGGRSGMVVVVPARTAVGDWIFYCFKNVCRASTVVHDSVLFDFKIVCNVLRLPHK